MRWSPKYLVALTGVAVLAAACGSSGGGSASSSTTAPSGAKHGGTLIVGAEQEPDCADWIGSCAGSSWGTWMMNVTTMPKVYNTTPSNSYVVSPLMASTPTLSAGPPQKVTYHINPKAVWSDGTPITSADFQYTWDQIVHGSDIYSTTGYANISEVQTPDPHTAIAVFSKPFADWRDLFGADGFGLYPSHLLKGQDRDALTKNGYTWSGGPWMIQNWTKGQSITLVPNPKYWGQKPYLDKVVFQIIPDTSSEAEAYKTGQFMMIYPQPQVTLADTVKSLPNSNYHVYQSLSYEGLWLNVTQAPLTSQAVRQALAYSLDRNTIVNQLFGPVDPSLKPLQSALPPALTTYYTPAFQGYTQNLSKVNSLMQGDGWTKQGGIWTKGGQQAVLTVKSTAGNNRRALMEQILQSQLGQAGFKLNVANEKAGTLFGQDLPAGNFQMGIYAQVMTSPDPSGIGCDNWCSANIPGPSNQNSGLNWMRINDPQLDQQWGQADVELDQTKRTAEIKAGQQRIGELVPFIPIDPLPNILVWSTKVQGPIGDNASMGPFWNMNLWYLNS